MKKIIFFFLTSVLLQFSACDTPEKSYYYQLKMYHLEDTEQELIMDQYLENAYLPALERAGIPKVGVFKPREIYEREQPYIMVLIPFSSLEEFEAMDNKLEQDEVYLIEGKEYIKSPYDAPPYERIESFLLRAFTSTPHLFVPDHSSPPASRVYELRSYESANDSLYRRKVEMFNEGECALFQKLGFQPVFFAEVLSSAYMPHRVIGFRDITLTQFQSQFFESHRQRDLYL